MKVKNYSIESADFMLGQREYRGERIAAVHEINGKIYLFTPNHTYVVRRLRWYDRAWNWMRERIAAAPEKRDK